MKMKMSCMRGVCETDHESLLSVENNSGVPPRKDMPAEMFPRVVAASGERLEDSGEKTIPIKTVEGAHRCINFRSATAVKPLISMR